MYKNKEKKYCSYCSIELNKLNRTLDHVFSKGLYLPPYSHNFLTVPACQQCNNYYSKYEEYFKHVTVIDEKVYKQEEFKKLGSEAIQSLKKHQRFYKDFFKDFEQLEVRTPGNIYLGNRLGVKVDSTILDTVIKKMMKGIYYSQTKKILDGDIKLGTIDTHNILNYDKCFLNVSRNIIEAHSKRELFQSGNVVKYRYEIFENHYYHSTYTILFYNVFLYVGVVLNNEVGRAIENDESGKLFDQINLEHDKRRNELDLMNFNP